MTTHLLHLPEAATERVGGLGPGRGGEHAHAQQRAQQPRLAHIGLQPASLLRLQPRCHVAIMCMRVAIAAGRTWCGVKGAACSRGVITR
eukprot:scaffold2377_cov74-Phaeocystis_antarctica.AAC.7